MNFIDFSPLTPSADPIAIGSALASAVLNGATQLSYSSTASGHQGICPAGWRVPSRADLAANSDISACLDYADHYSESCMDDLEANFEQGYGYRSNWTGTTPSQSLPADFYATSNDTSNPHSGLQFFAVGQPSNSSYYPGNPSDGVSVRCMRDEGEPVKPPTEGR